MYAPTYSDERRLTLAFIAIVVALVLGFSLTLGLGIWWGTTTSSRARVEHARVRAHARDTRGEHVPLGRSARPECGAGQHYDEQVELCGPLFPAPLAFVGPLMDPRYTACDVSFERMMCGGGGAPGGGLSSTGGARGTSWATLRHRKLAERLLQSEPFYRACTGARGTTSARRETAMEYRHVLERLMGSADLQTPADLPALWGRLTRAGYAEAAGAPFTLHRRQGTWYLEMPRATLERMHAMPEHTLYAALQTNGPISYGVVELQQRMQYVMETTQALYHVMSTTTQEPAYRVVPFAELPMPTPWSWSLYLGSVSAPDPEELVAVADLPYLEALPTQALSRLTIHHWRAWHELHIAQSHSGHVAVGNVEVVTEHCLNLTLALLPERVNALLIASVPLEEWRKTEAEVTALAARFGRAVRIIPDRECPLSFNADRFDHNINAVRAWRWAQEQTAPLVDPTLMMLGWQDVRPPLFDLQYGEVSRLAIFGQHLVGFDTLAPLAWDALPSTADRQHFLMVWAQALCGSADHIIDDTLRGTAAFCETMGCHAGQGMY